MKCSRTSAHSPARPRPSSIASATKRNASPRKSYQRCRNASIQWSAGHWRRIRQRGTRAQRSLRTPSGGRTIQSFPSAASADISEEHNHLTTTLMQEPKRVSGSHPSSTQSSSPSIWRDDTLRTIERRLAAFIGPVARLHVRNASARATDFGQLCAILAENLDSRCRSEFLSQRNPKAGIQCRFGCRVTTCSAAGLDRAAGLRLPPQCTAGAGNRRASRTGPGALHRPDRQRPRPQGGGRRAGRCPSQARQRPNTHRSNLPVFLSA